MENKWKDFYKDRVNSPYQTYFETKYKDFLDYILKHKEVVMVEAGCGIGSVSKFLHKHGKVVDGFDLCPEMVKLANINTGTNAFFQKDLFEYKSQFLTITHGVLEHFDDDKIIEFTKLYPYSINYVPLDKYITPSFGDERLLSSQYWIDLLQPVEHFVFNDGLDLCFKIKK